MNRNSSTPSVKQAIPSDAAAAAAGPGDDPAFAVLMERHRPELQVHCYRMLGSLHDAHTKSKSKSITPPR